MGFLARAKQPLKSVRWRLRRASAARRYGAEALAEMPIVIGNAMPKSGSHLLSQVLLGLTRLGPFVDPGMQPLTRSVENENLAEGEVLAQLLRLQSGDIAYAYLHARPAYIGELTRPDVAAFFIYRDPRDVLVSHVFYATEIYPGHGMHAYYQALDSMEARLNAAIEGVREPGFELSPIREKYDKYLGWLEEDEVLALRYEELVLERREALGRILEHLARRGFRPGVGGEEAIDALEAAIAPLRSGTFRKGQPGEWREHFSAENKRRFKRATGDLLLRLGYEQSADW